MLYSTIIDKEVLISFDNDTDTFSLHHKTFAGQPIKFDISVARQLAEWIQNRVRQFDDQHMRMLNLNKKP